MRPKTQRQRKAAFHFALAHARRLLIIEILEDHPKGITFEDLSRISRISQGSLSHHLGVLGAADLIDRTIRGPYSIYSLNGHLLPKSSQDKRASLAA